MNAVVLQKELTEPSKERGLLRFITAGSVDDGKSTLIGRLLFDSKNIFKDQLDALSRSKYSRAVSNDSVDLSLLTDGLEAEREQGITIDVAYRYFATPKRKFIIADTPGHEQYTRNMVTGASTADAVIILIDASKVIWNNDGSVELLTQTKRHSTIAHLLNIEHVIVAVNKMDLIQFNQTKYHQIIAAYNAFARQIGLQNVVSIPLSALHGDNVVNKSDYLHWYVGPTLMNLLESLNVIDAAHQQPLRFPVQFVSRVAHERHVDFRGYLGRVEAGQVSVGDKLLVQPGGQHATVKEIFTLDGSLSTAQAGMSITLLLNEHIDISRGDMLVGAEQPAIIVNQIEAQVCWLAEEPLNLKHKYLLKHTTKTVPARVTAIEHIVDINTQLTHAAASLQLNDIAHIKITVQQPLVVDDYADIKSTGAFILIDPMSHQTVAAGMIQRPSFTNKT